MIYSFLEECITCLPTGSSVITEVAMKLKDCDCGGIPHVTYTNDGDLEFIVICRTCGNKTPICENIKEAVTLWNLIYFRAFLSYEIQPA